MGKCRAVRFAFCCGAAVLLTACGQGSRELAKTPGQYVEHAEELIFSGETKRNLSGALKDYENALKLEETNAAAYLGPRTCTSGGWILKKQWKPLKPAWTKPTGARSLPPK